MIKSDLVQIIAKQLPDTPEYRVSESVNQLIDLMIAQLIQTGRIEIRGFGTFMLHPRAARKARNPKTGEHITIPAKYVLRFKPGKALKMQGIPQYTSTK
ncbi:MAG: integration host factor subunit beta [Gammaproteobacteria bacterium]|nr:integration host factor subunit beta [Gammaproteobacteria bacterium]